MAICEIFSMLLPLNATFLPYVIEELITCWTLCTLDEKVATITLPLAFLNSLVRFCPIIVSEIVKPSLVAFVLSAINKRTRLLPISDIRCKSITSPSTGV